MLRVILVCFHLSKMTPARRAFVGSSTTNYSLLLGFALLFPFLIPFLLVSRYAFGVRSAVLPNGIHYRPLAGEQEIAASDTSLCQLVVFLAFELLCHLISCCQRASIFCRGAPTLS
jgi:hypothetical protein